MWHSLRSDLLATLESWPAPDVEAEYQRIAWAALAAGGDFLSRHGHPVHFTASALPLSVDGHRVCLVLHGRMGEWVQPGGHLEVSDLAVAQAAGRELEEETGLEGRIDRVPVALSRHPAPCGVGYWHLDVQFLALCEESVPSVSSESREVAWFRIDHLPEGMAPGVSELVTTARDRLSRSCSPGPPPPAG